MEQAAIARGVPRAAGTSAQVMAWLRTHTQAVDGESLADAVAGV